MVSLMSSSDSKADFLNNKKRPSKTAAKSADRPNWFRGALWVPVMKRESWYLALGRRRKCLFAAYGSFAINRDGATQEATASSESLFRELRFSLFLSEEFAFCSALDSLSTKRRVSLADNSPSSPHLRLDRSGGHIGLCQSSAVKLRALRLLLCSCTAKIYGRNAEVMSREKQSPIFLSNQRLLSFASLIEPSTRMRPVNFVRRWDFSRSSKIDLEEACNSGSLPACIEHFRSDSVSCLYIGKPLLWCSW